MHNISCAFCIFSHFFLLISLLQCEKCWKNLQHIEFCKKFWSNIKRRWSRKTIEYLFENLKTKTRNDILRYLWEPAFHACCKFIIICTCTKKKRKRKFIFYTFDKWKLVRFWMRSVQSGLKYFHFDLYYYDKKIFFFLFPSLFLRVSGCVFLTLSQLIISWHLFLGQIIDGKFAWMHTLLISSLPCLYIIK